ncbi:MAG: hypothetical protein AAFY21_19575 [Cyanobacteria bacterium J06641_2]
MKGKLVIALSFATASVLNIATSALAQTTVNTSGLNQPVGANNAAAAIVLHSQGENTVSLTAAASFGSNGAAAFVTTLGSESPSDAFAVGTSEESGGIRGYSLKDGTNVSVGFFSELPGETGDTTDGDGETGNTTAGDGETGDTTDGDGETGGNTDSGFDFDFGLDDPCDTNPDLPGCLLIE